MNLTSYIPRQVFHMGKAIILIIFNSVLLQIIFLILLSCEEKQIAFQQTSYFLIWKWEVRSEFHLYLNMSDMTLRSEINWCYSLICRYEDWMSSKQFTSIWNNTKCLLFSQNSYHNNKFKIKVRLLNS